MVKHSGLVNALESALVISHEAQATQETLLQYCRQIVREQKLSVDDIRTGWSVSTEFAELISVDAGGLEAERPISAAESLFLVLHQEEDLLMAGYWSASIEGAGQIFLAGDFSPGFIKRWTQRAEECGVEIIWHSISISKLELSYYLRRMVEGIGAPAIAISSVDYAMDGATIHGVVDREEWEAWLSILPPWITVIHGQ